MNPRNLFVVSLLAVSLAACTADKPSSTSTPASHRVATASAVRVNGDLIPSRLVAVSIPKPTEFTLLSGSDPAAPKKPFTIDDAPGAPPISRDFRRTINSTDPAALTFPIDAPRGARVLVSGAAGSHVATVHMHAVATGARLDLARDEATSVVNVRHVPLAGGHPAKPAAGVVLPDAAKNAPVPVPQVTPSKPIERERGVEPQRLPNRVLSFDMPTTPGLVQLDLPADVASAGVVIEVQQPNSTITFSAGVGQLNHGFGENAEVTCAVANGGAGIDDATVTAWIELPDHSRSPDLTFTAVGGGKYVAKVPLASADWKYIGVWGIHAKATGAVNGVAFERDVESGFGYYPAHAQMKAIGTPVITRGTDGLIDDVSVDVDVETLHADRFSLRGTLTYTGADGAEHALATAQTGQTLTGGSGTITLRFDAASLALAKVDGPFHLRDVALVSQGFVITQHRLGRGLDLVTVPITATSIRFPKTISIQAQDLIDNGDLPPLAAR
jgi:hypothetical protein